ncbi:MAG TPA: hypothetical protein VJJ23_06700 [Candidatus Nanoarchaeia archaeon]|nr:hypothetical protein [Candidatus Nanoarchaeia archaeon]
MGTLDDALSSLPDSNITSGQVVYPEFNEDIEAIYDDIKREYEYDAAVFPKVSKRFLFWNIKRVTRDKKALVASTTMQRVKVTDNVINLLEKTLERKIDFGTIKRPDLEKFLAFEDLDLTYDNLDLELIDEKLKKIGSIFYIFPHIQPGYGGGYLVNGGIHLKILGSAIKNGAQYNYLKSELSKTLKI